MEEIQKQAVPLIFQHMKTLFLCFLTPRQLPMKYMMHLMKWHPLFLLTSVILQQLITV